MLESDSYDRYRSHYSSFVHIKNDTKIEKFYEIKKLINRRMKRYEKKNVTQYLIRWFNYNSKYDEWKSLSALNNFINLMKKYEKINSSESKTSITLKRDRNRLKKILKKSLKKELFILFY